MKNPQGEKTARMARITPADKAKTRSSRTRQPKPDFLAVGTVDIAE
jgi:hypothetical protein